MYEGIVLIVLVIAVVLAIRPARPIVRCEAGLYHATLAPGLVRVVRLIEQIATEFSGEHEIDTQCFEMQDETGKFLMAAGFRGGMLYFQVIPAGNLQAVRQFSDQVMINIPLTSPRQDASPLLIAVERATLPLKIRCRNISSIEE